MVGASHMYMNDLSDKPPSSTINFLQFDIFWEDIILFNMFPELSWLPGPAPVRILGLCLGIFVQQTPEVNEDLICYLRVI